MEKPYSSFAIRHSPLSIFIRAEEPSVLCRPGDDLLSRVLRQSTIGAEAFDGRVRDGIGSDRLAESHQAGEGRSEARANGEWGVAEGEWRVGSSEWGKEKSFSLSIRHPLFAIRHSPFAKLVIGPPRRLPAARVGE